MNEGTYEDKEYWDNLRKSRDYYVEERVVTEGIDGEDEFDFKILNAVVGKIVLDVGCGLGEFTPRIAERAKEVVGVDFSEEAFLRACKNLSVSAKKTHCRFEVADAGKLPFSARSFDIVVSRRGPVTDNEGYLSEDHRVLKKSGTLMEITIGEKDKANIAGIFGRGQMFTVKAKVAFSKRRMLVPAGFRAIETRDYLATEIFESMRDLLIRLNSAPIIPNFDAKRDRDYLELVEERCRTNRGIETEVHRVTIVASK
jgi:ubiquinone/menaquinone biosynthesis C-methylase UbiE